MNERPDPRDLRAHKRLHGCIRALDADPETDVEARIEALLRVATETFELEYGALGQLEGASLVLSHAVGGGPGHEPGFELRLTDTLANAALECGLPVGSADPNADEAFARYRHAHSEQGAFLAAPVHVDGETLGVVFFGAAEARARAVDPGELGRVALVAQWIGQAFGRRWATQRHAIGEMRYRSLFDRGPVATCEEDWTSLANLIDEAPSDAWFAERERDIARVALDVRTVDRNAAARRAPRLCLDQDPSARTDAFRAWLPALHRGEHDLHWLVEKKRGDGTTSVLFRAHVLDVDGRLDLSRVILTGTDLSEERARQRKALSDERHRRDESLAMMAGGIAHDFNNRLAAIIGLCDLLLRRAERDGQDNPTSGPLSTIKSEAKRASELSRQLLAYAGRGPAHRGRTDLTALVERVAQQAESAPNANRIRTTRPAQPLHVEGDAAQLEEMFCAIFENAIGASPEGCIVWARLRLDCTREGDYGALVEITDDGPGMDAATLERVLDPFYSKQGGGHGLGLAVADAVARSHGGSLTIESSPGMGTTAKVWLPSSRLRTPAQPLVRPAARGRRALVVDDESPVREVTSRFLSELGFACDTASDGAEGLDRFDSADEGYALVVTDLTMPRMDGAEMSASLRERGFEGALLVISGYAGPEVLARLPSEGAVGFLAKPFEATQLERALREIISLPRASDLTEPS